MPLLCVCMCVACTNACMFIRVGSRSCCWVSSSISRHLIHVGSISRWVWSSPVWPSLVTHPIPIPTPQGQSIVYDFLNAGIQAAAMAAQPSFGVQRSKQLSVSHYLLSHLPNSKFCFIPSFPLQRSQEVTFSIIFYSGIHGTQMGVGWLFCGSTIWIQM